MLTVCSFVLTSYANHYTPIFRKPQHKSVKMVKIFIKPDYFCVYFDNFT
nr:MAG TPA: hypothetical protein [Caudoviricetes sp.]